MLCQMKSFFPIALFLFFLLGSCSDEPDPPAPISSFSVEPLSAYVDEVITFTNMSQHAQSYAWDFGDGSATFEEHPSHIYTTGGNFSVTLTATGDGGVHATTQLVVISFLPPVASFTYDPEELYVGEVITFQNTSLEAISYIWDFGDGTISNIEHPTHTFEDAGTYIVELTAMGEGGVNTVAHELTLQVPINIFPGQGVMGIDLGDSYLNMQGALGDPDIISLVLLSQGFAVYAADYRDLGITFYLVSSGNLRTTDPVALIWIYPPFKGQSSQGISLRSTLTDIVAVYGEADDITESNQYQYDIGIAFDVELASETIEGIWVNLPENESGRSMLWLRPDDIKESNVR